ncbi:MAG: hypothetical protein IPM53_20940 [Anaerolineaceae bacterium]|nr:hypothetical protein [Anaerolineaceae bacterium]
MQQEIFIETNIIPLSELYTTLRESLDSQDDIKLMLLDDQNRSYLSSPEVLVALISFGSATLSAFIIGLLNIFGNKVQGTVVIKVEDGDDGSIHLEFPSNISEERLFPIIEQLKKMNVPIIKVYKQGDIS